MICLASQSPRRQALLHMLGLQFSVCPSDIDETMDPSRAPEAEVARVSAEKAAAALVSDDAIVIAADTIVVCGETILGKPKDLSDARRMLLLLSGRTHKVLTGLTVRRGTEITTTVECTLVQFRTIAPDELEAYLATGESMGKAGAYAIQGRAAVFCESIHGDYYNVMGLPLCTLSHLLRHFGIAALNGGNL